MLYLFQFSYDGLYAHMLGHVQLFVTPWATACQALLSMDSSCKSTKVVCRFLLQGIFLTQGSNLCLLHLLHWQAGFLPLAPPGKPINSNRSCGRPEASVLDSVAVESSRRRSELETPCAVVDGVASILKAER